VDVDFLVKLGGCCGEQLLQEGESSRGRLFSAVLAERVGLALRFENEGSEPGRVPSGMGRSMLGMRFCA